MGVREQKGREGAEKGNRNGTGGNQGERKEASYTEDESKLMEAKKR